MNQTQEFDRLEQFVQKLLSQYEQLLEKNAHLQRLLQQRDNEIVELKEQIDSAANERGDISNRIKNLIDQIEEWQHAVAEEEEGEEVESPEEDEAAGEEESETEEELSAEERDEGPQRNQRNLFQVGPQQEG